MFKKLGIGILLIGAMLISGCSLFGGTTPLVTPTPTETPSVVLPDDGVYDAGNPLDAPLDEIWISPATFEIGPYYAGYEVKCILRVHNGNPYDAPFSILYEAPAESDGDFNTADSDASSWIIISDENPMIDAFSTEEIIVTLLMPEDAITSSDKWEFLVCVKELGVESMIQTRLCTKFKVTME